MSDIPVTETDDVIEEGEEVNYGHDYDSGGNGND